MVEEWITATAMVEEWITSIAIVEDKQKKIEEYSLEGTKQVQIIPTRA